MTNNKKLTEEAIDFIDDKGHTYFETPNDYITYIFRETNFSDAVYTLNKLERELGDEYVLTQDPLNIIGDADEVFTDIDDYFAMRDFEGKIYEEEMEEN